MATEQVVNRYWQFAVIAEHKYTSSDAVMLAARGRVRGAAPAAPASPHGARGDDYPATTGQLHAEEREGEQHHVLAAERQLEAALDQLRMARTELKP